MGKLNITEWHMVFRDVHVNKATETVLISQYRKLTWEHVKDLCSALA